MASGSKTTPQKPWSMLHANYDQHAERRWQEYEYKRSMRHAWAQCCKLANWPNSMDSQTAACIEQAESAFLERFTGFPLGSQDPLLNRVVAELWKDVRRIFFDGRYKAMRPEHWLIWTLGAATSEQFSTSISALRKVYEEELESGLTMQKFYDSRCASMSKSDAKKIAMAHFWTWVARLANEFRVAFDFPGQDPAINTHAVADPDPRIREYGFSRAETEEAANLANSITALSIAETEEYIRVGRPIPQSTSTQLEQQRLERVKAISILQKSFDIENIRHKLIALLNKVAIAQSSDVNAARDINVEVQAAAVCLARLDASDVRNQILELETSVRIARMMQTPRQYLRNGIQPLSVGQSYKTLLYDELSIVQYGSREAFASLSDKEKEKSRKRYQEACSVGNRVIHFVDRWGPGIYLILAAVAPAASIMKRSIIPAAQADFIACALGRGRQGAEFASLARGLNLVYVHLVQGQAAASLIPFLQSGDPRDLPASSTIMDTAYGRDSIGSDRVGFSNLSKEENRDLVRGSWQQSMNSRPPVG